MKKIAIRLIGFCLIVHILALTFLYFFQEKLIFHASKLPANYQFHFKGNFEELNISVDNKTNLNGLLFKTESPKGLVFYLHGNAGTLDTWAISLKFIPA
ncbi:hypothetical protein [Flavobacterium sp. 3HN19-14]|uniref:hypothetical protein n=1 Tax=Flavobacterium sp. 3HN19-14 TaxID=3448133 RepID=UPI003EDF65EB